MKDEPIYKQYSLPFLHTFLYISKANYIANKISDSEIRRLTTSNVAKEVEIRLYSELNKQRDEIAYYLDIIGPSSNVSFKEEERDLIKAFLKITASLKKSIPIRKGGSLEARL